MTAAFQHYDRPRPRGAEGSGYGEVGVGILLLTMLVCLVRFVSPDDIDATWAWRLVALTLLVGGLGSLTHGTRVLWSRSSVRSRLRDRAATARFESGGESALLLRPFELDGTVPLLPADSLYVDQGAPDYRTLPEDLWINRDTRPAIDMFDALATTLASRVPLIAVGVRDAHRSPGGPGLVRFHEAGWKIRVQEIMTRANPIFIMPWPTEGTMWELKRILSEPDTIAKTVFIMPPAYGVMKERRYVRGNTMEEGDRPVTCYLKVPAERLPASHPVWTTMRAHQQATSALEEHGLRAPTYDPNGLAFFFREGKTHMHPIPYTQSEMDALLLACANLPRLGWRTISSIRPSP